MTVADVVRCPHCGREIPAAAVHCPRCGAVVHGADSPPPPPPVQSPPLAAQPWLQPDFVGEDDVPFAPEEDDPLEPTLDELAAADVPAAAGRLVSGVQGLLDPIRTTATVSEAAQLAAALVAAPVQDSAQLRVVKLFMAEEQPLAAPVTRLPGRDTPLWLPWVFLVLLGVLGATFILQINRPAGVPREWPGVNAAYIAVNQLPPGAAVTVFWAYDPATAGEMDLVAAPIMQHLLARGAQLTVVSLLPNAPATARRLIAAVSADSSAEAPPPAVTYTFLPGGTLVLPALAPRPAALAVVLAAQAADAQAWLELVAPLQDAAVIAGVAAGADPILRPYLDSGQLTGLVSGFDGAYSYAQRGRLPGVTTTSSGQRSRVVSQIVGQNVAGLVLIGLLLAGNVVALLAGRRSRD